MNDESILIIGANGQLGRALHERYPQARTADVGELDITNKTQLANFDWSGITTLINAAAYTNVDGAETTDGRLAAWSINAVALYDLATEALKHDLCVVHISTDYVFDGSKTPHTESEPFSPLNVYGETKAAGDIVISVLPKYYIVRTSWVIGDGKNFVRTMLDLGRRGIAPTVVADQIGRPTFTNELVRAIDHLLKHNPRVGIYNVSNGGMPTSWANIARSVFDQAGFDLSVTDISTAEYYQDKPEAAARPLQSTFDLQKIHKTGFKSHSWNDDLKTYVEKELA